jgi:peptidoglycan L-alanyl-D-glutamate endopeptidase CwlK
MNLDAISIQRLQAVNPALASLIGQLADSLASEGIVVRVTQGLRSIAEQDALYAQGRTTPGDIVTNAQGNQSWHCFGCAVDLVPMEQIPPQPDWDANHSDWKRMLQIGISLGLTEGAQWCHPDTPHFQITGPYPANAPNAAALQVAANGIEALWATITL